MDTISVRQALPEDAEEIAALYCKVWKSGYPFKDIFEPEYVRNLLDKEKDAWYTAWVGDKCIGSSVGVVDVANKSAELGRTAIDKKYRGSGIGKTLAEKVRDELLEGDVELLWGYLRNKAIYQISKNDGLIAVGHTEYLIFKERDLFLLGLGLTPSSKKKRVKSTVNEIYKLESVQKISKDMNLESKVGEYPEEVITAVGFHGQPTSLNGIYYEPNKGVTITSIFQKELPKFLQATILVDKLEAIDFFKKLNFSITAFLPGWFHKNNRRYDCILLTNSLTSSKIQDKTLIPIMEKLREGFKR
ncbi:MAG: GNAT family N-acetyltransferase [Candidatus Woesearchaeota archaeon]